MAIARISVTLLTLLLFALSGFAAISQELLDDLKLYSEYAAAAYCEGVDGPGEWNRTLYCDRENCPLVEANGARVLGGFLDETFFSAAGYVAVDPARKNLVLAFRGASGWGYTQGFFANFLTSCKSVCPECKCAYGCYNVWQLIRPLVSDLVAQAQNAYPDYPLNVVGYSIAGCQAIYAGAEFRNNGTDATIYTYGQPRAGDETLSQYVSKQGKNFRVTNGNDFIPNYGGTGNIPIPPYVYSGFRHVEPEYWIDRKGAGKSDEDFSVYPEDVKVVWGTNNRTGNAGSGGWGLTAHATYFTKRLSACFIPFKKTPPRVFAKPVVDEL